MVTNAQLQPGEAVLVAAASSGVGVAAVQIAALLGARPVIGSSGSAHKLAALRELGMTVRIDYQNNDLVGAALAATDGHGVDVVVDNVGGQYLGQHIAAMALKGRLVSVGRLAGVTGELDMDLMSLKRLRLIGVTFRTRAPEEHIAVTQRFAHDLGPALADGRLRPLVDRVFPLDQASEAYIYLGTNAHIGKIVLAL